MNERIGFWTAQAQREGFVRTRRRHTEVTETWWAICMRRWQPFVMLRTTAWYAHVDIDLLPLEAQLSPEGVQAVKNLWLRHCGTASRKGPVAELGPVWFVFERMDHAAAEAFVRDVVAYFRDPANRRHLVNRGVA